MKHFDTTTFEPIGCPSCDGAGEYYSHTVSFGRWSLDPPEAVFVPCEACEGTGSVMVKTRPAEPPHEREDFEDDAYVAEVEKAAIMRAGTAATSLWLPSHPGQMNFFEVDYRWVEYPSGSQGGELMVTAARWICEPVRERYTPRLPRYQVDMPKAALDAVVPWRFPEQRRRTPLRTLADMLAGAIAEQAGADFIDEAVNWS